MTISIAERSELIRLARQAVQAQVTGGDRPGPGQTDGLLTQPRGCFVTLTNHGQLRGCIGTFNPRGPLGEMIVEMGMAAAKDPRFVGNPITPDELGELDVEVSVLTPLEKVADPLAKIEVGRHGIYISSGYRSGCFLPEVATDQGWSAEQFLNYCCTHKAGLPPDAWKQPGTDVYVFESEKFSR